MVGLEQWNIGLLSVLVDWNASTNPVNVITLSRVAPLMTSYFSLELLIWIKAETAGPGSVVIDAEDDEDVSFKK